MLDMDYEGDEDGEYQDDREPIPDIWDEATIAANAAAARKKPPLPKRK